MPFPSSAEHRLAALDARAEAFEACLGLTRPEVVRRVGLRRQALRDAIGELEARVSTSPLSTGHMAREILGAIDELDRRMAIGRADRTHALAGLLARVDASSVDLEAAVATAVALGGSPTPVRVAMRRTLHAIDALRTELEVALARFRLERGLRGIALGRRRQQLTARIGELREQLATSRTRLAAERARSAVAWRRLERELGIALERMSASLDQLIA